MIVTITDIRDAGHCVRGARAWFDRHNLDFRGFLRNGIDAEKLLRGGDALAIDVVNKARERLRNG